MSELQLRPQHPDEQGVIIDTRSAPSTLEYVGFRVHRLSDGQRIGEAGGGCEICLVILGGQASVSAGGETFERIGERRDVFDKKPPWAVYIPDRCDYEITAHGELEVAVCMAPGAGGQGVRLIGPSDIARSTRGEGSNVRHIHDILPETEPADSLLVVEVYTPAGNWSSYPPHKHDRDNLPHESLLEESYYHRIDPPQGFAFQRVYTDDRALDETMAVGNGDCVLVPRGYHPVGAPHGYELYYLNVMAGPKRVWKFHNDPDHEWLLK